MSVSLLLQLRQLLASKWPFPTSLLSSSLKATSELPSLLKLTRHLPHSLLSAHPKYFSLLKLLKGSIFFGFFHLSPGTMPWLSACFFFFMLLALHFKTSRGLTINSPVLYWVWVYPQCPWRSCSHFITHPLPVLGNKVMREKREGLNILKYQGSSG